MTSITIVFTKEQAIEFIRQNIAASNIGIGDAKIVIQNKSKSKAKKVAKENLSPMYELNGINLVHNSSKYGVDTIKFIRALLGLGLRESKNCFDNCRIAPLTFAEKVKAENLLETPDYAHLAEFLSFEQVPE